VPLSRVLIANRGEIALRVVRACHEQGLEAVVVTSTADRNSVPTQVADRVVTIGPPKVGASYLRQDALLAAALGTGCDAVHPGYGFLAENPDFAEACAREGLTFVGPPGEIIRSMGNKLAARQLAAEASVPTVPGSPHIEDLASAQAAAEQIGYPLLIKAAAGGGGRGIRVVHEPSQLRSSFEGAAGEAEAAFGDGTVYIERYVQRGRHIEVQVLADQHGHVVHLGDRDCTMQRRYQKIIEEAPATLIPGEVGQELRHAAVRLCERIGYINAGTVEFIFDDDRQQFYFLEMNTRIQVEHPVTEQITGIDLVQQQLRIAAGEPLPFTQADITLNGHSIECRITAEDAAASFRPVPGRIQVWDPPTGPDIRLDSHVEPGYLVPPFYDSLLGKLIVTGASRAEAIARVRSALDRFDVQGVPTTIDFLAALVGSDAFARGDFHTKWVEANLEQLVPQRADR